MSLRSPGAIREGKNYKTISKREQLLLTPQISPGYKWLLDCNAVIKGPAKKKFSRRRPGGDHKQRVVIGELESYGRRKSRAATPPRECAAPDEKKMDRKGHVCLYVG